MERFNVNKVYEFDYTMYEGVMRQHGYQPDTMCKQFNGHKFTMFDNTNYVVLRKGHNWITVNPMMCKEVK